MKLTTIPPDPPESTYQLELTRSQLVALGVLSYRHEHIVKSKTFYRCLPVDIKDEIAQKYTYDIGQSSKLSVRWDD